MLSACARPAAIVAVTRRSSLPPVVSAPPVAPVAPVGAPATPPSNDDASYAFLAGCWESVLDRHPVHLCWRRHDDAWEGDWVGGWSDYYRRFVFWLTGPPDAATLEMIRHFGRCEQGRGCRSGDEIVTVSGWELVYSPRRDDLVVTFEGETTRFQRVAQPDR
jgi:hypothetical protein